MAAENRPTLRNISEHKGFNGDTPVSHPIFHTFLPGRGKQLCTHSSLFSHTLEAPLCASSVLLVIILGTEPGASSLRIVDTLMTYTRGAGRTVYTRVYPGEHSREAYSRVCTPPGYTPLIHHLGMLRRVCLFYRGVSVGGEMRRRMTTVLRWSQERCRKLINVLFNGVLRVVATLRTVIFLAEQ